MGSKKSLESCTKSELDLFSEPPVQTSILKTTEVAYKPISALSNDPSVIEFVSLGHGDTYRDLSSVYLRLQVRLMKNSEDEEHGATGGGCVVNNLLHSLFRQVSVYLNGVPISQCNGDYGYRAYIENLLNYGRDATSTHLETAGWAVDGGNMDATVLSASPANLGFNSRSTRFASSKTIELMGRVHADMFNQNRLLPNNVDLRLVFSLHNTPFYVMEPERQESYVKIVSATLYMNHVTLNPSVLLANEMKISRAPMIYPYKRVEIKTSTVSSGTRFISLDNVVLGQLPNLLLFAMVDNDAYVGKRQLNPFNFKHNQIQRFNLVVNGNSIPIEPLEFNYTGTPPISTRGYQTLFKDTGIHYFDVGHQITKKMFDNGFFLLAADLTSDHNTNLHCSSLLSQGTIRIEVQLAAELVKTITCLVYCEYDAVLKIDKNRNVYTYF